MKILKEGKLPQEKTYTATCRDCKTVFEFKQKEAKMNYDQRDGNYLSVNCPVCWRLSTHAV